ncbi:hypothetical protein EON79_12685 [bacterium]|nr:MAG: hypothetical protein EON79_12685 [bacterium]
MKRSLLLAFALMAGVSSAQNLPLWWSGQTGGTSGGESTAGSVFDGRGNLYTVTASEGGTKVTKFSNTGAVVWANTASGFVYSITIDREGNPVVTGLDIGADGGFNFDLRLTRFSAGTGTAETRLLDHPFNSSEFFFGYACATDPVDGNIVVAAYVGQGAETRPYIYKFDKDTLAEVWRTSVDAFNGTFTHLVVSGDRVYVGGIDAEGDVIVGYVTTNGALTTVQPTAGSGLRTTLLNLTVANDRLIWSGFSEQGEAGSAVFGEHYGQVDFSPGSGNTSTRASYPTSGTYISGVAYDASTGLLAFQASNGTQNVVRFATIDEATDGFNFGPTVAGSGVGIGLAPVTGGRFASYFQSDPAAPGQVGVSLLDPTLGKITGSYLGPGTAPIDSRGVPLGTVRANLPSLDRATAIHVPSPSGSQVYSLSYLAGPEDNRRLKEDKNYSFNVLQNDPGAGTKTAYVATNPAHGIVVLDPSGVAVYTPEANWHGTDSFVYHRYVDGVFASAETVTYTVLSVGDAPFAIDDAFGAVSSTALVTLPLLDNDINVDGAERPLRYLSVTQPDNGTVTLANNKTQLKIKAKPGAAGQPFTFTYTVQNGTGATSMATVNGTFAP